MVEDNVERDVAVFENTPPVPESASASRPTEEDEDASVWDLPSELTFTDNALDHPLSETAEAFIRPGVEASDASVFSEAIRASTLYPPSGLSPILSSFIVINYISAGYVLLPWAFAQGGTLLSCIVLMITSLQSNVTATFILEACCSSRNSSSCATVETWSTGNASSFLFHADSESYLRTFRALSNLFPR